MPRPLIGITSDVLVCDGRARVGMYPSYAHAVEVAGGASVLLTHEIGSIDTLVDRLDGFVLTGGDDPQVESFGDQTDPRVTLVDPQRQAFETGLLEALAQRRPDAPVLGVCLGMQMMALVAGGMLDQYMPDSGPKAALHWDHEHEIIPESGWDHGAGIVHSRHKQAVKDPGSLVVAARAPDGVVEALTDPGRGFYLGVQWHPERTEHRSTGQDLFAAMVEAALEYHKR